MGFLKYLLIFMIVICIVVSGYIYFNTSSIYMNLLIQITFVLTILILLVVLLIGKTYK